MASLKNLFGSRSFYKKVIAIALPIVLHQGITNLVNLLDNVMVGQLTQNAIAGVAAVNQFIFIFNCVVIGGLSGVGIFVAQYNGAKDEEGMRQSFRTKVLFGILLMVLFEAVFFFFMRPLLGLILTEEASLNEGVAYFMVILLSLPLVIIIQLYGTTLREVGHTKLPMYAGLVAVFVNAFLNYVLIFGKLGCPALGVKGAAIATVISRVVEALILVWLTHKRRYPFAVGAYTHFHISKTLLGRITRKAIPAGGNEFLWSLGSTMMMVAYAKLGENVVSAFSISQATTNLFYIMFGALATSISIIVGGELGANHLEEAKANSKKLITFGVMIAIASGIILIIISRWIPFIYNVNDETRAIASHLLLIAGIFFPVYTYNACCFFTLRAGGAFKQVIILDSVFMWLFQVVVAFALVLFTKLDIYTIYTLVQLTDLIKVGLASYMIYRGDWVINLAEHIAE